MTIGEDKNAEDVVIIIHETSEDCQKYQQSTECCVRAEGATTERQRLIGAGHTARVLGHALIVRGLPWKIFSFQNYTDGTEPHLYVSVVCDLTSDAFWSCLARVEVILTNFVDASASSTKSITFIHRIQLCLLVQGE